jgi:hypothetical protein
MNRNVAVFVVRSIGTLGGLLGAKMLYGAYCIASARDDGNLPIFYLIIAAVSFVIASFCIWIAYLAWFRFSPRAVQQVCGLPGFVLVGFVITWFPATNQADAGSHSLIYLGTTVFALLGYRLLSRYLNGVIFVDQGSASTSPSSS